MTTITAESYAVSLRVNLAEIMIARLKELGWSEETLATTSGRTRRTINNLLHGNIACSLFTVACVCHALGVKPKLIVEDV